MDPNIDDDIDIFDGDWEIDDSKPVEVVEDTVFEYNHDVVVMDEREVSKEVTHLLASNIAQNDRDKFLNKRLVDLITLILNDPDIQEIQEAQNTLEIITEKYILPNFNPVVSYCKKVYPSSDTDKPKSIIKYSDDAHKDKLVDFLATRRQFASTQGHDTLARQDALNRVYAPFKQVPRPNMSLNQNRDALFYWTRSTDQGDDEVFFEKMRVLEQDKYNVVGVVNSFPHAKQQETPIIYRIANYITFVNAIREKQIVYVSVHDKLSNIADREGLYKGTVTFVDDAHIKIHLAQQDTDLLFAKGDFQQIMLNPFTLQPDRSPSYFSKKTFYTKHSIVLLDHSHLVTSSDFAALLPNVSEWVYVNQPKTIHNLDDTYDFLGVSRLTKFHQQHIQSITQHILSNIDALPIHELKTTQRETKLSAFAEMMGSFASALKTAAFTKELLSQIAKEKAKVKDAYKTALQDAVLKPQAILDGKKIFQKLTDFLTKKCGKYVFSTLEEAFNTLPTNTSDTAAVYRVFKHINKPNKPKIKLPTLRLLYMLSPIEFDGKLYWMISYPLIQQVCETIGIEFDTDTHLVHLPANTEYQWRNEKSKWASLRLHDLESEGSNLKAMKEHLNRAQNTFSHPPSTEMQYIKKIQLAQLEGDEDFEDFEEMYNNQDFGANYAEVQDDNGSDDEENEDSIDLSPRVGVEKPVTELLERLEHETRIMLTNKDRSSLYSYVKQLVNMPFMIQVYEEALIKLKDSKFSVAEKAAKLNLVVVSNLKSKADEFLFGFCALALCYVQSNLPNVVITHHEVPECNNTHFNLEGFPLNDKHQAPNLITYFARLIQNVLSDIPLFKPYKTKELSVIQKSLEKHVRKLTETSMIIHRKLTRARASLEAFKESQKAIARDLKTQTEGIWVAYRPFLKRLDLQGTHKDIPITRLYDAIQQTQPVKYGPSKKPLHMNACCKQKLGEVKSFWKTYDVRMPNYNTSSHTKRGTSLLLQDKRQSHMYVPQQEWNRLLQDVNDMTHTNTKILDNTTPYEQPHQVGLSMQLTQFMNANTIFKNDNYLQKIASGDNRALWNQFATDVERISQDLTHLLPDANIKRLTEVLDVRVQAPNSTKWELLTACYEKFITKDLPQTLSRIANKFTMTSVEYIDNKAFYEANDRQKMKALYDARVLPELNELVSQRDDVNIQQLIQQGLCQVNLLDIHKYINEETKDTAYQYQTYLYMYVIYKIYIQLLLRIIKHDSYDHLTPEDLNPKDKAYITSIIQTLVNSFNTRYHIAFEVPLNCTEEYEKQREQSKQGAIKQYDQMDKNDRNLYREMKQRGLQNLMPQRTIIVDDDEPPLDVVDQDHLNIENDNEPDENVNEINEVDDEFANFRGENPDNDDDD